MLRHWRLSWSSTPTQVCNHCSAALLRSCPHIRLGEGDEDGDASVQGCREPVLSSLQQRSDPGMGNRGWVSVPKIVETVGCLPEGRRNSSPFLEASEGSSSNDRISLPTPAEGSAFRDLRAKGNCCQGGGYCPISNAISNPWLSQTIL